MHLLHLQEVTLFEFSFCCSLFPNFFCCFIEPVPKFNRAKVSPEADSSCRSLFELFCRICVLRSVLRFEHVTEISLEPENQQPVNRNELFRRAKVSPVPDSCHRGLLKNLCCCQCVLRSVLSYKHVTEFFKDPAKTSSLFNKLQRFAKI